MQDVKIGMQDNFAGQEFNGTPHILIQKLIEIYSSIPTDPYFESMHLGCWQESTAEGGNCGADRSVLQRGI